MANEDDPHDDLPLRIDAAAALGRLSHALVGHRADAETLKMVAHRAAALAQDLEQQPTRTRGDELAASPRFVEAIRNRRPLGEVTSGAFIDMFEDSPVSGSANPLSIGLRIGRDGDEALGIVTLQRGWEGAPGRSHGGIVAACIDETIGGLLPLLGEMAFTGELNIRYEAPCPMGVPLEFRAWLERRDGRKLHISCIGTADGAVFARAKSLFIVVELERFHRTNPVGS